MDLSWLKRVAACCVILIVLGSLFLGFNLYRLFYQPMLTHQERVVIRLDKSTSAASFVRALQSQHYIRAGRLFLWLIRLEGLSHQLKAGIYQLKIGESAQDFLYRVVAGDVLTESFAIIEGTTQKQVAKLLASAPYLTYNETDWSKCKAPYSSMEGLLLADTYYYNAGSFSGELLTRACANLFQYLDKSWQQRDRGLPYKNAYALLIAASIIEKEAALPSERRLIAGVIVNRLTKYMPLQMDPTVIYALGSSYNGKLTHQDLQIDSPFNTYRYRGLPPTPIAMVGKQAIDAAAHPQQTDYLYYVAKGDGSHEFSVTYEKQRAAISRYLK